MKRRTFLKASVTGAAVGAVAAPSVLRAAETFKWKMTTSFPPGLPFYQSGPGSAEWIVKSIEEATAGRLKIKDPGKRSTWAYPVVHDGRLYLRYGDKLGVYDVSGGVD